MPMPMPMQTPAQMPHDHGAPAGEAMPMPPAGEAVGPSGPAAAPAAHPAGH
jgi:hypothetical protein